MSTGETYRLAPVEMAIAAVKTCFSLLGFGRPRHGRLPVYTVRQRSRFLAGFNLSQPNHASVEPCAV